jgi:heme-degrading monooxygenase HmoA
MYVRATRVQIPPDSLEKGIAFFKETVMPMADSTPGNLGQVLLIDRESGRCVGITLWESGQAMGASEQMGVTSRTGSIGATGGQIVNVERMEQVINERAAPPQAGSVVRLNTIAGDPAKTDNAIKFVKNQVTPALQSQKGFQALIMNVDRLTGRSTVSTIWATRADLEASESSVSSLRRDAADAAGAKDVTVEIYESAVTNVKMPATA